jgi:hypothetical protein
MLCHTNLEQLPNKIIAHGNITDNNNQKISWDPQAQNHKYKISDKALRCILLKNDIFKGIKIDESLLEEQNKQVSKYYLKIKNILHNKKAS